MTHKRKRKVPPDIIINVLERDFPKNRRPKPFWKPQLDEISKHLWIPTDDAMTKVEGARVLAGENDEWFHFNRFECKLSHLPAERPHLQWNVPRQGQVRTKKPKPSVTGHKSKRQREGVLCTRLQRIYPYGDQLVILVRWYHDVRYVYNLGVCYVRSGLLDIGPDDMDPDEEKVLMRRLKNDLRNLILSRMEADTDEMHWLKETMAAWPEEDHVLIPKDFMKACVDEEKLKTYGEPTPYLQWLSFTPYHILEGGIDELVKAIEENKRRVREGDITHFDLSFKKRAPDSESMIIQTARWQSNGSFYMDTMGTTPIPTDRKASRYPDNVPEKVSTEVKPVHRVPSTEQDREWAQPIDEKKIRPVYSGCITKEKHEKRLRFQAQVEKAQAKKQIRDERWAQVKYIPKKRLKTRREDEKGKRTHVSQAERQESVKQRMALGHQRIQERKEAQQKALEKKQREQQERKARGEKGKRGRPKALPLTQYNRSEFGLPHSDELQGAVRLVHKKRGNRYYAAVLHEAPIQPSLDEVRAVALDPGVKTFLTAYDPDGHAWEVGTEEDVKTIRLLCLSADRLQAKIDKAPSRRKASMRRALQRMRDRVKNRMEDMHWKVAKFLCENYDTILLPKFSVSSMCQKTRRIISSATARSMLSWSHYTFRQRLLSKAREYAGRRVVLVDEAYSSKTCTKCHHIKSDLTLSDRVYVCRECGLTIGRDFAAGRNIFLGDLVFELQDDAGEGRCDSHAEMENADTDKNGC